MKANQFLACVHRTQQAFGVTVQTDDPRIRRNAQRRFDRAYARALDEWDKLTRRERQMVRACDGVHVIGGALFFD